MRTKQIQEAIENALALALAEHASERDKRWSEAERLRRRLMARLLEAKEIAARLASG